MNLGAVGEMFISLRAEGADKVVSEVGKTGKALNKTAKESEKTAASFFTLGNVLKTSVLGAIAGIVWNSPVMMMYLQEFGYLLGYIGDTIGELLAPFIDILLDGLWTLGEWFESYAPILATALEPLIPAWRNLVNILVEVGKVVLPFLIGVIGNLIKFITDLFTAIYNKDWDEAWNVIATAASNVWNWISTNIVTPVLGWIGKQISSFDWNAAWKSLSEGLNWIWTNVIKPLLPKWLTDYLEWMYEFYITADAKRKLQMIGEAIVDAMKWGELGARAAKNFMKELIAGLNIQMSYTPGFHLWNPPPSYQEGTDYVPATGLYTLHRGEAVIPAGETRKGVSSEMTINNTFNITGNNPRAIAEEVMRIIAVQSRRSA